MSSEDTTTICKSCMLPSLRFSDPPLGQPHKGYSCCCGYPYFIVCDKHYHSFNEFLGDKGKDAVSLAKALLLDPDVQGSMRRYLYKYVQGRHKSTVIPALSVTGRLVRLNN